MIQNSELVGPGDGSVGPGADLEHAKALLGVNLELTCGTTETSAQSDATGRFLITSTGSGHCKLEIDGATAGQPKRNYGVYFPGVNITSGRTNVLPYLIWLKSIRSTR